MHTFTAFLRGINVGGHHKVPMADLKIRLGELGCERVQTLLNSGNVVFDSPQSNVQALEVQLEQHLAASFGFPVPVVLRTRQEIADLLAAKPFAGIEVHQHIRLYVSFLKHEPAIALPVPYLSSDGTFQILSVSNKTIVSVLDLSTTSTPKGMDDLEKLFGKNITTRNWNTIEKIGKLLEF